MSSDFSQLVEVADIIDSSHQTPTYVEHGVPMVRVTDVKYGALNLSSARHVSVETFRDYSRRYKAKLNDIIISRVGSYGNTAWVVETEFCLGQNVASISPKTIDARYLFFALNSGLVWSQIESKVVGSTQKTLSLKAIKELRVPRFGKTIESEIGGLLGALDDRITLLRETNATLEAIAQALFKSWFIDFDPVRAKQEGRAPEGMDDATAALFPDGFEESELGLVPRGWRVAPVGEVVDTVGGGTPDTKDSSYWEPAEHCWTTPKDLSGVSAPVLLGTERKLSAKGLSKISSGLLPAGTLLMSSRAPIGYLAITQVPMAINQGYIAMLSGGLLPPIYMLYWCRQNMETIRSHANGSTFMEISKKAFRPLLALVPTADIVEQFVAIAGALFERLVGNEKQAQTLATLRDTLLPRLISGQLRLPEDERFTEEVA